MDYPAELGGFPTAIPQNEPLTALIRPLLRVDAAFDEICKAAGELRSDLVITATCGHTGLKHVLLGGTAE